MKKRGGLAFLTGASGKGFELNRLVVQQFQGKKGEISQGKGLPIFLDQTKFRFAML